MAHLDLFGVTASLRRLLRINVWRLSGQVVTVSALPPEEAEKETGSRLNLHLYHAVEDPNRRNDFPLDDLGPYPISRTPLPLTLYYALTAHATNNDVLDPASQQLLMGLGMKSMHDFPVIDDSLELPGPPAGVPVQILQAAMRGHQNRIEIAPRPTTPEETVNFWSAAQNHTARLTAYYEVRSLLMPLEEATEKPSLVAAFALGVGAAGRPTLFASSSVQTVTLPALSGGTVLATPASPAVAALGSPLPAAGNRVTLTGESLGDGTNEKIIFSSAGFAALSPPLGDVVVDPASNPEWQFQFRGDHAEFLVQPVVNAEAPGGFAAIPIRPGIYAVAIRRNKQLITSAGATTMSSVDSNRISFAVGPLVTGTPDGPGARIRFTLASGIDCTDPLNLPQLTIAGEVYRLVTAFAGNPTDDAGSFIAQSPTRYEAEPLFDRDDGATRMARLAVNGVDAPPFWLEP